MSLFQIFATEFSKAFTRDNPRKVWSLKDESPEWMRDAIRCAHFDDRLPDDWIYEHAKYIVDAVCERDEISDDDQHEICDGLVDLYTSALTEWLGSNGRNTTLVDDAMREGLVAADATIDQRIQSAQYMALTYIYGALVSAIQAHADEMEPEYYAAHDCDVCDPVEHCTHGDK